MLLGSQLADVSTASPNPLQCKSHKIKSSNKSAMITALQKQRGKMIIKGWTCLTTRSLIFAQEKYKVRFPDGLNTKCTLQQVLCTQEE